MRKAKEFPVRRSFPPRAESAAVRGIPELEQGTGIEPAFTAWEAVVLPIYEPCVFHCHNIVIINEPREKIKSFSAAKAKNFQKRRPVPIGAGRHLFTVLARGQINP